MFNHQPPLLLLFSCLQVLLINSASGCPSFCACKWKNGKQTVNCSGKSLADIPNDLDPGTQVLEFNHNTLKSLPGDLFSAKQLINLQRIYLAHCKIKLINEKTFNGLSNLVELDLSHNSLETVPTASFVDCPSLMRLSLSYNPIKVLKKLAFNHLTFLNTLELTACDLANVDEEAFRSLHSLEWLMLDGNKLKTVRGVGTLPENLKGVRLHGNAWECDCHIKDLHTWLKHFKVPTSEEPSCSGPARLAGRHVKSMASSELACLPDVSPTTFYLELAEGKNVSLLCHVHAVPEAAVSWWFQGQVLQNNSAVAPGIHLVYFVEEGVENKRSELFIYNANSEDNGTFVCNAENAAGVVQSNFTIRVIIKEDPVVIIVSFPFEYLVAGVAATTILALLVIVLLTTSIMRCRRRRRRMLKRDKTKDVTLHYQQQQNQHHQHQQQQQQQQQQQHQQQHNTMTTPKFDAEELIAAVPAAAPPPKVVGFEEPQHAMSAAVAAVAVTSAAAAKMNSYVTVRTRSDELLSAITAANQVGSPASLRRYQLEQNPDLINGTESVLGCEAGGDLKLRAAVAAPLMQQQQQQAAASPPIVRQGFAQIPVSCLRTNPRVYSDIRWDPCLVDADGYPIDYGLPKAAPAAGRVPENYYRTLPSNRMRRQSAANPRTRYSQEAEFLAARNCISPPYDLYHTDVRYTADGYPVAVPGNDDAVGVPPPEASSGADAVSSLPCCSVQWPACVPANMHNIASKEPEYVRKVVTRRCVGAQTDTATAPPSAATKVESQDESVEVLTESPDEGYEGEPSVV